MYKNRLLVFVFVMIIFTVGILACSNSATIPRTFMFALIPHEPGAAPMVPHPEKGYIDCDLCHVETAGISIIKIDKEHGCTECHDSTEYDGICLEDTPINATCALDICHLYP
ncbi:MAG: hypothetical protein JSV74_00505 [Dehalococcoidia bacterium]|nr:MAG: hypothetical protein JSV74_00505 [Dehalococcoidia bacterium]